MSTQKRSLQKLPSAGPFIAVVTNHLDTSFMGGLEVAIIRGAVNDPTIKSQTFIVSYLNPFYGITNVAFEGNDRENFNDVQKSYGMWMIPPDVGTKVMVIFVDNDPTQGYWFGCVMDRYQNHMIPGIAASQFAYLSQDQKNKYDVDTLPVAEFHKKSIKDIPGPQTMYKPVHKFADRLLQQGLLEDNIRGITSSSARREIPSNVFGISTPGPLDPDGPKNFIGYDNAKILAPISRLGGTTFVMDDGDVFGQNELVRLRTRTGHQILLHNTEDLIYIANSKGTAWIELTSSGKIDIYASDSVSIHTEADFNFRADRDINLEAGRNFNLRSGGEINFNTDSNFNIVANADGKLSFNGAFNLTGNNGVNLTSGSEMNVKASGQIKATATKIHLNGPEASTADKPNKLQLFSLPSTAIAAGWGNKNRYKSNSINSIMQRVPMHEPWTQHETLSKPFSSSSTDSVSASVGAPSSNEPLPPPNGNQPANWSQDKEFIDKVKEVSSKYKCDYVDLLACMSFETGYTFDPAKRNSIGATGLIQFIESTAKGLGTTTQYLGTLSRTQQMKWVSDYFNQFEKLKRLPSVSLEDLYMSILWPDGIGQPNDYVLFRVGSIQYSQNAPLDIGGKGYITKADASTKVRQHLPYVRQQLANAGYTS